MKSKANEVRVKVKCTQVRLAPSRSAGQSFSLKVFWESEFHFMMVCCIQRMLETQLFGAWVGGRVEVTQSWPHQQSPPNHGWSLPKAGSLERTEQPETVLQVGELEEAPAGEFFSKCVF